VFGDFGALHGNEVWNGEKRKKNGAWVHATTCPLVLGLVERIRNDSRVNPILYFGF